MPRRRREVVPNYPYHIVQRGHNKQKVFHSETDYQKYYTLLMTISREEKVIIQSYCLMPNHIHHLLIPETTDGLALTMRRINITYTHYYNRKYQRLGTLWQGRYYSSIVDKDSYLWIVSRYVERNPVRAGIVEEPEQYKWSSARFSLGLERNFILDNRWWLNGSDKHAYAKFLKEKEREEEIYEITYRSFKNQPLKN